MNLGFFLGQAVFCSYLMITDSDIRLLGSYFMLFLTELEMHTRKYLFLHSRLMNRAQ